MKIRQSPQDFIQMITRFKKKNPEYRNWTPKALAQIKLQEEIKKNSSLRNNQ